MNICKAYSGGSDFPEWLSCVQYGFLFWEAEQLLVRCQDPELIGSSVHALLECGLAGEAKELPIQLRACLFSLFCKGADNTPEGSPLYLWEAERAWCGLQETEQGKNDLGGMLDEYLANGLRDFENMDGVPVSLKAVLFNRFSHWNRASTAEFKAWYLERITQRRPTGTLAVTFTQRVLPAYLALSPKMEERLC